MSLQFMPIAGLLTTIAVSACMVVQQAQQAADLRNAPTIELHNAGNQVVLNGMFTVAPEDEDDDDEERVATLTPTGIDRDATGRVEIEYLRESATRPEFKVSGRNLSPGAVYSVLVDGTQLALATADERGRISIDMDVPIPGATAIRR